MSYEMLVGLEVTDDTIYNEYRAAMKPILYNYGGGFGYDFKIDEVLKSEVEENINRVFTINFPDEDTMNKFFSDEEYLKAKTKYFEKSVKSITIISEYTR